MGEDNAALQCINVWRSQLPNMKIQPRMATSRIMTPKARLTGEPIMRIFCKKTDTLVGYLYQWNNGDLQPVWLQVAMPDVRYEPMVEAA